MKIITIFLLLLFAGSAQANYETAIINDPDGYTNIRSGKGIKYPVINKIYKDEFFSYEPNENETWLKVIKMWNIEGYVHKSRIIPLNALPDSKKRQLIKGIFKQEKITCNNFLKGTIGKRSVHEDYHERRFNPILDIFTKYTCKNKDISLLNEFLEILILEHNSADEAPPATLGKIYLCQPDMIINVLNKKKSRILVDKLEFGFLAEIYNRKDSIKSYEVLKTRINNLKEKLQ